MGYLLLILLHSISLPLRKVGKRNKENVNPFKIGEFRFMKGVRSLQEADNKEKKIGPFPASVNSRKNPFLFIHLWSPH